MRPATIERRIVALLDVIPGVFVVDVHFVTGLNHGWRISAELLRETYENKDAAAILSPWTRWPWGLSLGAGRTLRRAFRDAAVHAGELRALLVEAGVS